MAGATPTATSTAFSRCENASHTISATGTRNAMLTAKVEYQYHCKVPWGRFVICGLANFKKINAEASMTAQGADYAY